MDTPVLSCPLCAKAIVDPSYRLPGLMQPVCATCFHTVSMVLPIIERHMPPLPLPTNPYKVAGDMINNQPVPHVGGYSPAGVQSSQQEHGPSAMRYMTGEEVRAYVAAFLRFCGNLREAQPRYHRILRLSAPAEPSESDAPKQDQTP